MYMYISGLTIYMQCMYLVHTTSVKTHTGYNQLFYQVFGAYTEMQYVVISHSPHLQGRLRMGAVPVQKMVNFFMQGQTQLKQKNLPDKTGEKAKWNFEKAHSILHKVREIVLWGN